VAHSRTPAIASSRAVDRSCLPDTGTSSASNGANCLPAGAWATAQHFSRAATTPKSYLGALAARGLTTRGVRSPNIDGVVVASSAP
jgi:hypothetical protein